MPGKTADQPALASCWQVAFPRGQLVAGCFSAQLDFARPQDGLVGLCLGEELPAASIFQVQLPAAATEEPVEEAYARAADLYASYAATERRPFRCQLHWQVTPPSASGTVRGGVNLIISVQTHLPDSLADISVGSHLRADDLVLVAEQGHRSLPANELDDEDLGGELAAACLLLRVPDGATSCATMIDPADFRGARLTRGPQSLAGITYRLFSRHLEKGVILRARLRSVFIDRENDVDEARRWYRAQAGSPPPLEA